MSGGIPGITMAAAFPELTDLDPILTEIFYQHLVPPTPMREALFSIRASAKGKETDLRLGSFRSPQEFNGQIDYVALEPDHTVEYRHKAYVAGFKVERELRDDNQYDDIFDATAAMGSAFGRRQEEDAASVFNNAFSTAGYDAVALCSASHPRSELHTTTVANYGTYVLNRDNLFAVRRLMKEFVDDKGNIISVNPDILLVPLELEMTAYELTKSVLNPETADNAANMFYGLRVMVWPYLTDANAWFLIDSRMAQRYLKWYDRVRPEFGAIEDFDTFQRKYRGYMRYSYGWSDWRWVFGSNPS